MNKSKMPANLSVPNIARAVCYSNRDAMERWNPTNMSDDDRTISIMDVIGENWCGEGVTAKRIGAALRRIGDNDVIVNINSPGGSFFEGLAIYNLLRNHSKNVTVNVMGLAASAASFIAMAGDTINVAQAGFLMIHNTQLCVCGDRNDLQDTIDTMSAFDDVLSGIYSVQTGIDKSEISALLDNETWISGEQAVDQGFADGLLNPDDIQTENRVDSGEFKAIRVLDSVFSQTGFSRSEGRALVREIKGKPGAAEIDDTQDAVVAGLKDILKTSNNLTKG